MEKKELLGILGDFKRGDLTINEANERILVLFGVVERSEQLVCDICEEPLEKLLGKVCENTMCDRHR